LKVTLFAINGQFQQIDEEDWNQVVSIQIAAQSLPKTNLSIMGAQWGESSLALYTDNPIGQISSETAMPMLSFSSSRLLLASLDQLNIQLNFNMKRAVIDEIMPTLDTKGQDLNLQYNLQQP
jgi:hypothetical protein